MEAMRLSKMGAWSNYQVRRMGWRGLTGLILLFASLVMGFGVLIPEAIKSNRQQAELETLREQLPSRKGRWVEQSPQSSLDTFYRFLPDERKANAQVGILLYAAEVNALVPDRVTYKLSHDKQAAISRYQINLPLRGTYMQIRSFVNQALNEMPSLALNEISFTRPDADSEDIEANISFTLFLRAENHD